MTAQMSEFWRDVVELAAWGIAGLWCWRTSEAIRYMPTLPDLSGVEWDIRAESGLTLTVVVPAKDEAATIAATLDALMMADYPWLRVLVVDDRSTDLTATIAEAYVLEEHRRQTAASGIKKVKKVKQRGRLEVIRVTELPEGWMGKTFAMQVAIERIDSDYVLFTDADVLHSPSILRRAMAYAERENADHLVVLPTMQVKSRGEGIVLGFFQIFGLWASRPWKVADASSLRDIVGVGAFNLVRRQAFEEIGGWAPQRMAVLEDITLGRRMKAAGMRQRIAFAPGLVLVHWAAGAGGLMRVMTKNLFSAFNFNPLLLVGACVWIGVFCMAPLAGLGWWPTVRPSVLVLLCMGAAYRVMGAVSLIDARYAWLYPLGAMGFVGAMLRSMVVVAREGGVTWRGTFYALSELRRHNSPFVWERAARVRLSEQRMAAKMVRRAKRSGGA